jgi:hypothetical protein
MGETPVELACASGNDRRGRRRAKVHPRSDAIEIDPAGIPRPAALAVCSHSTPASCVRLDNSGAGLFLGSALRVGLRRVFRCRVRSAAGFSTLLVACLVLRHSRTRRRCIHPPRDNFLDPVAAGAGSKQGTNDHRGGKTHHERRLRNQGAQANGPKQGTLVTSLGSGLVLQPPDRDALGEDVLVAWAMNGAPLPPQHGFPLRLVVPGWYGMASVKWLDRIEAIDRPFDGAQQVGTYIYREQADEPGVPVTAIRVKSLMVPPGIPDWCSRHRLLECGPVELFGRAWSGGVPVVEVEVAVDGRWRAAALEHEGGRYAWRGNHSCSRALDHRRGVVQQCLQARLL